MLRVAADKPRAYALARMLRCNYGHTGNGGPWFVGRIPELRAKGVPDALLYAMPTPLPPTDKG